MTQVYLWMLLALLVTAGVAQTIITNDSLMDSARSLFLPVIIVQVLVVILLSLVIYQLPSVIGGLLFLAYSALNGFTLSVYLQFFEGATVVSAAVSTACLFGVMSIVGATTKINLSKFGGILLMAVLGLIIAIVVNIFLQSSTINLLISVFGVLIFTGLTAYDTQRIQNMSRSWMGSGDMVTRAAILGAFTLYLDLINMFIYLLRLMSSFSGNR
jgi:hypothetical protein